jgi:hypothetical protein
MRLVRVLSCVTFSALAIAACSKPAPTPKPEARAGAAAPEAEEASGPEIPADQLPLIKAGLWETVQTAEGKAPRVERRCESGKRMPVTLGQGCDKITLHKSALGTYTYAAQCGAGDNSVRILMKAKGDFQSRYAVDFTTTLKLAGAADVVDTSHREFKYVGACPAGMEAAD